jgi:hypothetical protein
MKKFWFKIRAEETTWATSEEEWGLVLIFMLKKGGGEFHVTESRIRRWVRKNSVMDFQVYLSISFD